jgi:hypothetical protein
MTNAKALFYPTIEINDEGWLKASLLFWDEIKTIVPESIDTPYHNRTTSILAERGILKPEIVNPDHYAVRGLSDNVLEFINSEEGLKFHSSLEDYTKMHLDKTLWFRNLSHIERNNELLKLHPRNITRELRHLLEDTMLDGWLMVNSSFASFYMTLLANKICEASGLSLLSNNPICSNLANKVKLGITGSNIVNQLLDEKQLNQQLANGIFTNLIIDRIDFHSSTNVIDILSFKTEHSDALGLFRANIKKLLEKVSPDSNTQTLRVEIENIYQDEFLPSFNNLKKELDQSPLKWSCENIAKIGFFSVGTTAIPTYILGLTMPQAILAGAGVSLVTSLIAYNLEKQKTLRENPYNYLLELNNNL